MRSSCQEGWRGGLTPVGAGSSATICCYKPTVERLVRLECCLWLLADVCFTVLYTKAYVGCIRPSTCLSIHLSVYPSNHCLITLHHVLDRLWKAYLFVKVYFYYLLFLSVCVCVDGCCMHAHMSAGSGGGQKRALNPPDLELQVLRAVGDTVSPL